MHCRICDNAAGNTEHEVAEMMFGTRDVFVYVRCAACGCVQIRDYPADIGKYYGADYYAYHQGSRPETVIARLKTDLGNRYAVDGRGRMGRYLHERSPNPLLVNLAPVLRDRRHRILDVGCGSGAFAALAGADRLPRRLRHRPLSSGRRCASGGAGASSGRRSQRRTGRST